MISRAMKEKYAYTLARVGLNVQKGQIVLVEACIEGYAFTSIFAKACYELGASQVVIHYLDYPNMKVASHYRSLEEVAQVEDWEVLQNQKYLDQGACYVRLEGVNPALMEDLEEDKSNAIFAHVDAVRNIMRKASREKHCQWLIAMVPTVEWATYLFKDLEPEAALDHLWEVLLKLCLIDEENDVVKTWEEKSNERAILGEKLDNLHLVSLHYTSKSSGTDLTVGLTPYSKFGSRKASGIVYHPNIPTEEICTTPEKYATEGIVFASKPLVLGGKQIQNFGFRFEKGKVMEVIADEGKEMLCHLVTMDENAGYLGEAALVAYHSPISMSNIVYYTTLIDENASCHLALGRGLSGPIDDERYTFNDSTIHIDFMIGTADLDIVGTCEDGTQVQIFKDGDFAL